MAGARAWLFVGFVFAFGGLLGSLWVLIQQFVVPGGELVVVDWVGGCCSNPCYTLFFSQQLQVVAHVVIMLVKGTAQTLQQQHTPTARTTGGRELPSSCRTCSFL